MSSVPQVPRRDGMRVDIRNVLGRTAHFLKGSGHYETGDSFVLEEFCRHLGELGNRYYQGDKDVMDEFLQLSNCDESPNRATPNRAPSVYQGQGPIAQATAKDMRLSAGGTEL